MSPTPILRADHVSVTVGERTILDDVTLEIAPGTTLALVGPNGAGKSTLLGVLSGELASVRGAVTLDGRALRTLTHLERSRLRSVLTQENAVSFPFAVRDVVEMGRAPWARRSTLQEDELAVDEAIAATDTGHLLARAYPSLSGGEKARVSLARVLAQRTPIVLLDEPTAALDLRHQEDVLRIARRLAAEGRAVVTVLHDLSLAGAYADEVAMLDAGRIVAHGTPAEVLTAPRVEAVYRTEVRVLPDPDTGRPIVLPRRSAD